MKILLLLLFFALHAHSGVAKRKRTPVIEKPLQTIYRVRLNDTARLPCTVKKQYKGIRKKILFFWSKLLSSKSSFEWIRLNLPRHNVVFNEYLEIENVQSTDHGNYTCYAKNHFGTDYSTISLIVIDRDLNATVKPRSLSRDDSSPPVNSDIYRRIMGEEYLKVSIPYLRKYFIVGKQAKMKCLVKGESNLRIKWLFNGKPLQSSLKYIEKIKILKVQNFTSEDVGNYTCIAVSSNKKVNMTIAADILRSYKPTKATVILTAKPGENITLTCEVPADKVKYTMWDIPEQVRKQNRQRTSSDDLQKDLALKDIVLNDKTPSNHTFVETYELRNVSERLHTGKYICKAAFVNGDTMHVVKEYIITFKTDITTYGTTGSDSKLLMIVVPIAAVILTIVIVLIICLQCRKKHNKLLSQHSSVILADKDDEEDGMSFQILTKEPHGSLTIHRKSTDETSYYTSHTIFNNSGTLERRIKIEKVTSSKLSLSNARNDSRYNGYDTISECPVSKSDSMLSQPSCDITSVTSRPLSENFSRTNSVNKKERSSRDAEQPCASCTELRNSPEHRRENLQEESRCSVNSLKSQKIDNSSLCALSAETKNSSWPGQRLIPGDSEYIDFLTEDQTVCLTSPYRRSSLDSSNKIRKTKTPERNRRRSKTPPLTSRTSIHSDRNSISTPPSTISSLHNSDNDLTLYVSKHPEDEDCLLKREMKMWEPLIKNSMYDKNANVKKNDESTKLLSTLSPSDELSHRDDLIL